MRSWAILLGGLVIWTVHFFALYIVASIWLTTPLARMLAGAITLVCLGAIALALAAIRRTECRTPMDRWTGSVGLVGLGIGAIAVFWQALPALLI